MVRYFYAWTPAVAVFGTVIIMSIPYLAVIVLMVALLSVLAALAALARAIVSALYPLARSVPDRKIPRTSQERSDTRPQVALSPGDVRRGGTR
jgi:hypothetical protein